MYVCIYVCKRKKKCDINKSDKTNWNIPLLLFIFTIVFN